MRKGPAPVLCRVCSLPLARQSLNPCAADAEIAENAVLVVARGEKVLHQPPTRPIDAKRKGVCLSQVCALFQRSASPRGLLRNILRVCPFSLDLASLFFPCAPHLSASFLCFHFVSHIWLAPRSLIECPTHP